MEQQSLEQQSLEQGTVDMSEKDPHMGALLDKLQGSIIGRHIDIRQVKVLRHQLVALASSWQKFAPLGWLFRLRKPLHILSTNSWQRSPMALYMGDAAM